MKTTLGELRSLIKEETEEQRPLPPAGLVDGETVMVVNVANVGSVELLKIVNDLGVDCMLMTPMLQPVRMTTKKELKALSKDPRHDIYDDEIEDFPLHNGGKSIQNPDISYFPRGYKLAKGDPKGIIAIAQKMRQARVGICVYGETARLVDKLTGGSTRTIVLWEHRWILKQTAADGRIVSHVPVAYWIE